MDRGDLGCVWHVPRACLKLPETSEAWPLSTHSARFSGFLSMRRRQKRWWRTSCECSVTWLNTFHSCVRSTESISISLPTHTHTHSLLLALLEPGSAQGFLNRGRPPALMISSGSRMDRPVTQLCKPSQPQSSLNRKHRVARGCTLTARHVDEPLPPPPPPDGLERGFGELSSRAERCLLWLPCLT